MTNPVTRLIQAWGVSIGTAKLFVGGLSNPSKMPGKGYGLPAQECNIGSKLRGIANSVCSGCYAFKGRYTFQNVIQAQYRRLATLLQASWTGMMAIAIGNPREPYFRWHDAGDIQSMSHLIKIVTVAMLRPDIHFWLPTREYAVVQAYQNSGGHLPPNLVIRQSAPMMGAKLPSRVGPSSMVLMPGHDVPEDTHLCPAPKQANSCGDCRACWNPEVLRVAYKAH